MQAQLPKDPFRVISSIRQAIQNVRLDGVPDPHAYASFIKACNKVLGIREVKATHGHVIRAGMDCDTHILNSLIHSYLGPKRFDRYASVLFDRMPIRTVVSVNCMLSGFVKNKEFDLGFGLFKRFVAGEFGLDLKPNYVTLMVLVSGCVETGEYGCQVGKLLHCYCCKTGLDVPVGVCNALIDFYAKVGFMGLAESLFNGMVLRDLVSWNTMIAAYARSDASRKAFSLFREMGLGNVGYDRVSLVNLMLACANGRWDDVLQARSAMVARRAPKMAGKSFISELAG
ncbi:hypothetical protein Tsubulata_013078 [Turnera subulata]|uniref:Pentacotripeptide-repeat region of PRORP domain-containing protein n=1 Tax=Turnera subulata TaxID=218843 RepID=A0A9Q0J0S9_9ROSI|nr:hypothetical protein Tsubulata_013078 [Turnera subulata]